MKRIALILSLTALPAGAAPITLSLPEGAAVTAQETSPATDFRLLTGPWTPEGGASEMIEGARDDTAWRLRANQDTSLQILAPLRAQIAAAGYETVYECETDLCGGFDFRYALSLLPEPQMHVDLGDFRYLAARRGAEWLALTVSRSSESGFINLTTVTVHDVAPSVTAPALPAPQRPAAQPSDLTAAIVAQGAVALDDLAFASGATTLEDGDFPSLRALADYLATRPAARIALVGHTDTTGTLEANVAVSLRRAEAVRSRLVERYGVRPAQVSAEGAGWLAPRTSNATPEGRERNRRVEAIVLPDAG